MIKKMHPGQSVSSGSLRQLVNISDLVPGKFIDLGSNLGLFREKDHFRMGTFPALDSRNTGEDAGRPEPGSGNFIREIREEDLSNGTLISGDLQLGLSDRRITLSSSILQLDAGKLVWPLQMRHWKAGDRFRPLGMEGTQLVSDHLTNRKVVGSEKRVAMVLVSFDGNICAVIFPPRDPDREAGTIDDRYALVKSSNRILTIERL
jgi:tRNA(Ile)-lysidine synthase